MARIKITGYLDIDPTEVDDDSPTGLTEEAFVRIVHGEFSASPKVSDLEDVETEPADE